MPQITWISEVVTGMSFPEVIQNSGDVVLYCQVLLTLGLVEKALGTGSSECVTLYPLPAVFPVINWAKL
jgi:hypothetical protein